MPQHDPQPSPMKYRPVRQKFKGKIVATESIADVEAGLMSLLNEALGADLECKYDVVVRLQYKDA